MDQNLAGPTPSVLFMGVSSGGRVVRTVDGMAVPGARSKNEPLRV